MMIDLNFFFKIFPQLFWGGLVTLQAWFIAACLSLILGTLWGLVRSKRLRIKFVSSFLDWLTLILRAIPFYVQLLIAYFVIPDLLKVNTSPLAAAVGSLVLCSAAYVSQIIMAGINAVPMGLWEAAFVLGYSKKQKIRYIILPEVFRQILPSLCGELDQLLKSTALFSSIGILDLTGIGRNIIAREMNPLTVYLAIAFIYCLFSFLLNFIMCKIEKRLSYD